MALWEPIACPFSDPPPVWHPLVAVLSSPSGLFLVRLFAWVLLCVSPLFVFLCLLVCLCSARVFSVASVCLPLCTWALCCAACGICGRLPPSPLGCFRVASWPSKFLVLLVPPSGYLVASCDGLVALPYCLECCGALLPRFILLHGSKGLWPCVGYFINPLHHGAYVVVGLCAPSLRYSSS